MNFDINVKISQYMVDCFAGPTLPLNELISIICTCYVSNHDVHRLWSYHVNNVLMFYMPFYRVLLIFSKKI